MTTHYNLKQTYADQLLYTADFHQIIVITVGEKGDLMSQMLKSQV